MVGSLSNPKPNAGPLLKGWASQHITIYDPEVEIDPLKHHLDSAHSKPPLASFSRHGAVSHFKAFASSANARSPLCAAMCQREKPGKPFLTGKRSPAIKQLWLGPPASIYLLEEMLQNHEVIMKMDQSSRWLMVSMVAYGRSWNHDYLSMPRQPVEKEPQGGTQLLHRAMKLLVPFLVI